MPNASGPTRRASMIVNTVRAPSRPSTEMALQRIPDDRARPPVRVAALPGSAEARSHARHLARPMRDRALLATEVHAQDRRSRLPTLLGREGHMLKPLQHLAALQRSCDVRFPRGHVEPPRDVVEGVVVRPAMEEHLGHVSPRPRERELRGEHLVLLHHVASRDPRTGERRNRPYSGSTRMRLSLSRRSISVSRTIGSSDARRTPS